MKKHLLLIIFLFLAFDAAHAGNQTVVSKTTSFTHPTLQLTVVGGELELPDSGPWEVKPPKESSGLSQVYLVSMKLSSQIRGRRFQLMQQEKDIERGRNNIAGLWRACFDYASVHDGMGPSSIADLDQKRYKYIIENLDKSPWPEDKDVTGPFSFLVPGVKMQIEPGKRLPTGEGNQPLLLELRPYVDDGKQWVILVNGRAERQEIDKELLQKYNLSVTPVRPAGFVQPPPVQNFPFRIIALRTSDKVSNANLKLKNALSGEEITCRWDLQAETGDPELLSSWAKARASDWLPYLSCTNAPVLRLWSARLENLYGPQSDKPRTRPAAARGSERTTSMFNVLGGRAAVRETLQMESLWSGAQPDKPLKTISLAEIKGVEVKSHPFEEMLGGRPGGEIALADIIPADRFFAYFAQPKAIFPFLDEGADFLFRSGSLFTVSTVDDNLKKRYLGRLGLTEKWGRRFIESDGIQEMAIVTSDLFFIDGTDVTLVMRVSNPRLTKTMLKLLDIVKMKEGDITPRILETGNTAFLYGQGDLLMVSSNRKELEGIIALNKNGGSGSLGQSAEFRYMLEQLPLKKETRAYVYLSDPFIRRMVGPEVKIGQLRRLLARSDMEMITAGALLAGLDGKANTADLPLLMELGYLPESFNVSGYTLGKDLVASSEEYGTPVKLRTLQEVPVDTVTESESRAYASYRDNYSRYWRQYFDPIAMRLDDAPGGDLEMTTFILPLVDSQIYNWIKAFLQSREDGQPLQIPSIAPEPVLTLSANLPDREWIKATERWSKTFSRYTNIAPAIFDYFGPAIHLTIQDADPIIVLGNGDILGGFSGGMIGANRLSAFIPAVLSVLTRPCQIFIELQDGDSVLEILRRAATRSSGPERLRGMMVELRQVEGGDRWIYTLNLAGLAKIRLGIEIQDNYLIISNVPWSQTTTVHKAVTNELNGAGLMVNTGAVKLQLPALFAAESELNQMASLQGMASLYPLLLTISSTPEDAALKHAALFGYKPLHPAGGKWIWKDGHLKSSLFGNAVNWKQPLYKGQKEDFGLFQGVEHLSVNMQIEDTGLRAVCRWTWKDKKQRR